LIGRNDVLHCVESRLQDLELAVDGLLGRLLLVHSLFLCIQVGSEFCKGASSGVNFEMRSFALVDAT
jgi:hypothetical protein